jgi:hypothetical protein
MKGKLEITFSCKPSKMIYWYRTRRAIRMSLHKYLNEEKTKFMISTVNVNKTNQRVLHNSQNKKTSQLA